MMTGIRYLVCIILHVNCVTGGKYLKVDFCEATEILISEDTLLMLDCIHLCHAHPQCKMFTREGVTCTLYPQPVNDQCQQGTQLTQYFVQQDVDCMNAGYMSTDDRCVCIQGFVGANCSTRMTSCSEGYQSGNYNNYDGVLPVHPPSLTRPFFVHCDMANGGRLYIQSHEESSTNLYRTWSDMAEGFGSLLGDHWLGNRHLHDLLSTRNMVFTVSYTIYNGSTFTRSYSDFKIKHENDNFAIESYTSTSGDLGGDCLSGLIGKAFSTSDRDMDGLSWWSCAQEHGGAWWFDLCEVVVFNHIGTPALCNPNGQITPTASGLKQNASLEIFWVDFPFAVYKTHIWLTDSL